MSKNININHPCFTQGGCQNQTVGRLHLPVSPLCNMQCKFCIRAFNKTQKRPGVSAKILEKEKVFETVKKALCLCPEINVVGIAGPGESLATDDALNALEIVHREFPFLIKCLSTNGLFLPFKIKDLVRLGVLTISVTINAVNPEILSRIISYIFYNGKIIKGIPMGEILIKNQLEGIRQASLAGIKVKVNTVLIPSVNDFHIEEIAKTIKEAGADIYNIIPLIPQGEFNNLPAPSAQELLLAQKSAEKYLEIFYHCQRCRADACGIPSKNDFANQLYEESFETFSHG
ncbi:MAG: radical SAM protein [Elusimicrobiota bacterium]|jgi:nitrogen fixation protein NifB|nr:radical SAM protein [Elusimicrobiota bacterium]